MESAAYGCATITSKRGGLPETFDNQLFIENVNETELYKLISKLINNKKFTRKNQKKNWKNVKHRLDDQISKIDTLKKFYLNSNFMINEGVNLKILHISTFDERNDHRLFNISISNKLSKGFIRNGHDVINFSYRNFLQKTLINKSNKIINEKIINICDNYRPNIVVLGHNNILEATSINIIKKKYSSKFTLWYEDALGKKVMVQIGKVISN